MDADTILRCFMCGGDAEAEVSFETTYGIRAGICRGGIARIRANGRRPDDDPDSFQIIDANGDCWYAHWPKAD